jgi:hypothetical protein
MKNITRHVTAVLSGLILFSTGCSTIPRGGVKAGFDFSKIKTIGIGSFAPSNYTGDAVSAEFAKQFLQRGYVVKYSRENVDVILEGSVTQYSPAKKFLFTTSESDSPNQLTVNQQQVIELSGSNAYSMGTAFGLNDKSKIVVSNSTIGMTARLVVPGSNEVVWTNSYNYEGLDINSAIETTVDYLIRSIVNR